MDVTDALYSRYSTRAFRSDPVDKETIARILEAATRAPSWGDTQPWEIFVACGKVLDKLRKAYLENFNKCVPAKPDLPGRRNGRLPCKSAWEISWKNVSNRLE